MKRILKSWLPMALLLAFWLPAMSQGEDHNWTAGNVHINFPGGGPATPVLGGAFPFLSPSIVPGFFDNSPLRRYQEGVATISDQAGNMLFYSNGSELYRMVGGTPSPVPGFSYPLLGDPSGTQSATLLPSPGVCDEYILITVDDRGSGDDNIDGINLYYFNMGGAVSGPIALVDDLGASDNFHEGLTVVPQPNCRDYWLIAHSAFGNRFHVYELTSSGVNGGGGANTPTATYPVGINFDNALDFNAAGTIKVSRQGDRIAMTSFGGGWQMLDFDPAMGIVGAPTILATAATLGEAPIGFQSLYFYGTEFSGNGEYIYLTRGGGQSVVGDRGKMYRFEIGSGTLTTLSSDPLNWYGAIQRGPDNALYFIRRQNNFGFGNHLARISDAGLPIPLLNFNFIDYGVLHSGQGGLGLGLPAIYDYPEPEIEVIDDDLCDLTIEFCELNMRCDPGPVSYTWDFGDGESLTTNEPCVSHDFQEFGDYTVTVTVDDLRFCTHLTSEVPVSINSCCTIDADWTYVNPANAIITENTFWDGKVLVGDDVTVTVQAGVTLDVTNADVLFDLCGALVLEDGACLRANNSVFRPCTKGLIWRGISFEGAATGTINECTFKSALAALSFEGPNTSVQVANNLFSNCRIGVVMDEVVFSEGITGNTFQVEESDIDYLNNTCGNVVPAWLGGLPGINTNQGHIGIVARMSSVEGKVSQNDFIFVKDAAVDPTMPKFCHGIILGWSDAEITGNHFSDQLHGVSCLLSLPGSTNATLIENNEFEVTLGNGATDAQVNMILSENVQVLGNVLRNSQAAPLVTANEFGISVIRGTNVRVNANDISGFLTGIRAWDGTNFSITENTIQKAILNGIDVQRCDPTRVACNTIDMEQDLAGNVTGIRSGIFVSFNATPGAFDVISNCIFDAEHAIAIVNGLGTVAPFGRVTNNYLYNYRQSGIFCSDFDLELGTGLTYPQAGRNTFASNHIGGGAIDLNSSGGGSITSNNNFGIVTWLGSITLNGTDDFHSTASCGQQLGFEQAQLLDEEVCDRYWNDHPFSFPAKASGPELQRCLELIFRQLGEENGQQSEVDLLLSNWETVLDSANAMALHRLAQSESPLALYASVFLKKESWWYPLTLHNQKVEVSQESTPNSLNDHLLELSPNPTSDVLNVHFYGEEFLGAQLRIRDAFGREVQGLATPVYAGNLSLNVSELAAGIYFLQVKGEAGKQLTERFVIQ